jgi:benzoylformate decarboxylase
MRLAEAFLEILVDEGVDRVFGNPGTTELTFVDALAKDGRLPYVLGAHEGPVVAMADGYARATRRPAFVSLHVAAGTANGAIGMLNALRSRTPLVVLAGQQDSRHLIQDPMLSGDLVGLAQAATKWAVEARRADEVPTLLRRAFRAAVTPPAGPVFLSVPMDLFDEELQRPVPLRTDLPTVHPVADLTPAVDLLWSAASPAVVAGDGVGRSEGVAKLVRVAETLGAPVYHAPMNDCVDFPMDHAAYRGMLAPENDSIRRVLDKHDVVLLAGVRAFVPHHYNDSAAVGPGTRLVQVDDDPSQVGRNYPAEVGLVGDVRLVLDGLATSLEASRPADQRAREPLAVLEQPPIPDDDTLPFHPRLAAATVAANLPAGAVVVEEAITTGLLLREHLRLAEPGSFHHTVGGGLGWGAGAAIGVALGRPGRRVVAALGDGCTLFGVQALWTAAREHVPVTFVVFANQEYRTLKQTLTRMRDGRVEPFVGMDLGAPAVDWPTLAHALGVPGVRAADVDELADLVASGGPGDGPLLVDVPIRTFADEHSD